MDGGGCGDDEALRDRLKELKKGLSKEVTVTRASNRPTRVPVPLNEPSTAQDRLSDRLKLLRLCADQEGHENRIREGNLSPIAGNSLEKSRCGTTQPQVTHFSVASTTKKKVEAQPPSHTYHTPSPTGRGVTETPSSSVMVPALATGSGIPQEKTYDVDSFLQSDDQTLEELLEGLGPDENTDTEPSEWALKPPFVSSPVLPVVPCRCSGLTSPVGPGGTAADSAHSQESHDPLLLDPFKNGARESSLKGPEQTLDRMAMVLEELSENPIPSSLPLEPGGRGTEVESFKKPSKDEDEDDSDGEIMKAGIEDVLMQATMHAQLGDQQDDGNGSEKSEEPLLERPQNEGKECADDRYNDSTPEKDSYLFLPEPPSSAKATSPETPAAQSLESRMAALSSSPPQVASIPSNPDVVVPNFTSRLASLRSSSLASSSPLNFPNVPKNAPGARGWKTIRCMDEDMETWCTVCLADANLICTGCDDEFYCTRCWHDMHKGPQAGFEEMGHRAEIFERGICSGA